MKNVFAYYNMRGRLIRVKEDTLSHFKDITPFSAHKVDERALKASYLAWRNAETDKNTWQLIGSYDFFADADAINKVIETFKGLADYRKPIGSRSKASPELIATMKSRHDAGESMYRIAQTMNMDKGTVRYYIKQAS